MAHLPRSKRFLEDESLDPLERSPPLFSLFEGRYRLRLFLALVQSYLFQLVFTWSDVDLGLFLLLIE